MVKISSPFLYFIYINSSLYDLFFLSFFCFLFCFLGYIWFGIFFLFMAIPEACEVPRLKIESELQLPAYTTATEMPDPSLICDLSHSNAISLTHQARPGIKPASSQRQHHVFNLLRHNGNSWLWDFWHTKIFSFKAKSVLFLGDYHCHFQA